MFPAYRSKKGDMFQLTGSKKDLQMLKGKANTPAPLF